MNPRLIAISGPREGQVFPLRGAVFRIGRHADNDLQLPSVEVSRHHCEVRRSGDEGFEVVDAESRHGISVNSRPIRRHALRHSDLLTVGGSVLLFLLDDDSGARPMAPGPVRGSAGGTDPSTDSQRDQRSARGSTITRRATDLLYLDRQRIEAALPAQARIAHGLHALLQASAALQAAGDVEEVAQRLVQAASSCIPGPRWSAFLLPEDREGLEDPDALELVAARGPGGPTPTGPRDAPSPQPWPDASVLEALEETSVGALALRSESDPGDGAPIHLLAAALRDAEGVPRGVIYGEVEGQVELGEDPVELLAALATLASPALQRARRLGALEREAKRLRAHQLNHDLVGQSPPMERLLTLVTRVARADSTVLVRGESGTGKELVAQAIHRSSERADQPFVAINCATLSDTLFESELFGHEKGAFTGAVGKATGQIEAARGGTLFLDEVGEIPPRLQAKLLRVLQERRFTPVGSTRSRSADVRVVAATNRDLEAARDRGEFRDDLYYRLGVISLDVPPLRQRRDDIPLLARHFLDLHGRHLGRGGVHLSPAARRCLVAYSWPGNVRELGNVIERALVLGETSAVQPEDLPDEVVEGGAEMPSSYQDALRRTKEKLVLDAFRHSGGEYAETALRLGIHVNSLHRLIRRLGLRKRLES